MVVAGAKGLHPRIKAARNDVTKIRNAAILIPSSGLRRAHKSVMSLGPAGPWGYCGDISASEFTLARVCTC
eukprot:1323309-Amorphochlora_amoeboformis.AAC.1